MNLGPLGGEYSDFDQIASTDINTLKFENEGLKRELGEIKKKLSELKAIVSGGMVPNVDSTSLTGLSVMNFAGASAACTPRMPFVAFDGPITGAEETQPRERTDEVVVHHVGDWDTNKESSVSEAKEEAKGTRLCSNCRHMKFNEDLREALCYADRICLCKEMNADKKCGKYRKSILKFWIKD